MAMRIFSFAEILLATNHFNSKQVIGRGPLGTVYMGVVKQGVIDDRETTVAIKRLNPTSRHGAREFETEVSMLSKFRHDHIVSLLGYCNHSDDQDRELILVNEFMPRGNVADRLFNGTTAGGGTDPPPPPLSWVQRLNICIDAAKGLNYLHTGTDPVCRIIHRDVKSSNILLDKNLAAKVTDFGVSKLTPPTKSYYMGSSVKGTLGYLDPAYMNTRRVTTKSDLYSFGVVMLEMLCGRAAVDLELPQEQQRLTKWAKPWIETDSGTYTKTAVRKITDGSIVNEIKSSCLEVYVKLVNQCLHDDPSERPTMVDVVSRLQNALSLQ